MGVSHVMRHMPTWSSVRKRMGVPDRATARNKQPTSRRRFRGDNESILRKTREHWGFYGLGWLTQTPRYRTLRFSLGRAPAASNGGSPSMTIVRGAAFLVPQRKRGT